MCAMRSRVPADDEPAAAAASEALPVVEARPTQRRASFARAAQVMPKRMMPGSGGKQLEIRKRLGRAMDNPFKVGGVALLAVTVMICMIIISVLNFFFDTMPDEIPKSTVRSIEWTCTVFFTLEVAVRTFVATLDPKKMMLCDPTYWIDVLCIVPFYVELGVLAGGEDTVPDETMLSPEQIADQKSTAKSTRRAPCTRSRTRPSAARACASAAGRRPGACGGCA